MRATRYAESKVNVESCDIMSLSAYSFGAIVQLLLSVALESFLSRFLSRNPPVYVEHSFIDILKF